MDSPSQDKILIVKLAALGDVLVSSPFPRLMKIKFPNLVIHHLVMDHCSDITKNNPYIDKQIIIKAFPSSNKFLDILRLFSIWNKIRKEKYNTAIIFHRSFFIHFLCKVSGIKYLYGFKSNYINLLNNSIEYTININRTVQERNLLIESGYLIDEIDHLDYYPDENFSNKEVLSLIPDFYYTCNPGGGNLHSPADNRMWPIEYYAELINALDFKCVILGHGDSDVTLVKKLKLLIEDKAKLIDLVGMTSISDTAYLLKNSIFYIGNDSSLIFLAAALDVQTIGLYGPTQSWAASPAGGRHFSIPSTSNCSPCYNPLDGLDGKMYKCSNNICMKSIKPDSVIAIATRML